ncbi:DNA methyltransferase [Treponema pedis]|uniref:DNA methyltransferase n=1 Tax=Treponema pedis TaxID=409322 RepID=UPI000419E5F7|nr:DNA methyltransferase [Treponema pedis]
MSQKLELTWYGKDTPVKVEPRILIKDDKNSNPWKDGIFKEINLYGNGDYLSQI